MRRFLFFGFLATVTCACIALVWVAIEISHQSTRDEARPSDVIVVLGAAEYMGRPSPVLKARLDHALDLYNQGIAPLVLVTGGFGEKSRFTEAEAARDYLVQNKVPSEDILMELEGTSTFQSIAAATEIFERMNLKSCVVVSDGYHIYRAKKMLERRGIRAYGSPRYSSSEDVRRRAWLYLRQAAGYWVWYLNLAR